MISVVIPLFNQSSTVGAAIESVLAQSYPRFEVLLVNDGSTDGGAEVVAAYTDPRIRVIHQVNQGVSVARNRGIQEARGDLVAFLDADDLWTPSHLENLRALCAAFPGAAAYATAYSMVRGDRRREVVRSDLVPASLGLIEDYFSAAHEATPPVQTSGMAARRADLLQLGGFPPILKTGEDLIMWARLAARGPIAYCRESTVRYLAPPIETAQRMRALRRPSEPDLVGEELLRLANRGTRPSIIHRYRGSWHRMRAMLYLELNERRSCLREVQRAIAADRFRRKDALVVALLLVPHGPRMRLMSALREARERRTWQLIDPRPGATRKTSRGARALHANSA